jgi:hypothetical protein
LKEIKWTDPDGRKRARLIRNRDPASLAQTQGIPQEPPELDRLNWQQIKVDLHNRLMDLDLLTWKDVQKAQTGVTSAILTVLRKRVINLYKEKDKGG